MTTAEFAPAVIASGAPKTRRIAQTDAEKIGTAVTNALVMSKDPDETLFLAALSARSACLVRGRRYGIAEASDVTNDKFRVNELLSKLPNERKLEEGIEILDRMTAVAPQSDLVPMFLENLAEALLVQRAESRRRKNGEINIASIQHHAEKIRRAPISELPKLASKTAVLAVLMGALPKN